MKLISLDLWNFGPYREHHHLALDVSEAAPVVLIYGENMRGKTTLLRAIKWALYGEVQAHDGSVIDPADFANYDARDGGESFDFGVQLTFEDRGSINELRRMCTASSSKTIDGPTVRIDDQQVSLRPLEGNPIPEKDIPEFVARTLHRDIADFFLFDGEMLTRFEETLRSDVTRARAVMSSIERVLGLPALQLAKRDLESLLADADAVLRRAARRKKQAAELERQWEEAEDKLARLEGDEAALLTHQAELETTVAELAGELARVDSVKELFYQRRAFENEVDQDQSDLNDLRDQYRAKAQEAWYMPLATRIEVELSAIDAALTATASRIEARDVLRFKADQLREQAAHTTCSVCAQQIPPERLSGLAARLQECDHELALLGDEAPDFAELQRRRSRLSTYSAASAAAERLQDLEQDITRLEVRIADRRSQINDLSESLRDTRLDIAALETNYQEKRDLLRETTAALESLQQQRTELSTRMRGLAQEIAKHAGEGTPEKVERDVLDGLVSSFDGALDRFRSAMRSQVEREASAIFGQLTTEPDYAGLRIDGRYFLEIIDENDHVIRRRSAGADQIVTMSFIGALVRCAVRQGPVVMDTPFGRLDRGHRERILRWVPTLGTQVVLFVQSGEFDREKDIGYLKGMVGREYALRRLSATSTTIERVSND